MLASDSDSNADPRKGMPVTSFSITGEISEDHNVLRWAADLTCISLERIRLTIGMPSEIWPAMVFRQSNLILTNWYLSATIEPPRLLIDQSYENLTLWASDLRPKLLDKNFTLHSESPTLVRGAHVIIGGPIDGVWYHWLANWCTRIVLLQRLRPDVFNNPDVKFVVDKSAVRAPFVQIMLALGITEDRLLVWDQSTDLHLTDAIVVSFMNQNYLYPDLMRILSYNLKKFFCRDLIDLPLTTSVIGSGSKHSRCRRRIFASRQGFTTARRRVKNFTEIECILNEFGFDIVELGKCTAEEQITMFSEAEFVLGVHGSDLVNVMFCPPKSKMLVIENERNISSGLSVSLNVLSNIFEIEYHCLVVDEFIETNVDYSDFTNVHYRDVVIPTTALREALIRIGCHPIA